MKDHQNQGVTGMPGQAGRPGGEMQGGPQHGGHFAPPVDRYVTFSFSEDNAAVESMTRVVGEHSHAVDIEDMAFVTTVGSNDLGIESVVSVEQTRTTDFSVHTTVYDDSDGDGQYLAGFRIDVLTALAERLPPQQTFSIGEDGSVTATATDGACDRRGDIINSSVVYSTAELDGDTYVVRTNSLDDELVRFTLFRDDDGDGAWTAVVHGASDGVYIDATTGLIDLVGIQGYLAASDAVIG